MRLLFWRKNAAVLPQQETLVPASEASRRRPAVVIAIVAASFLGYQYAKKLGVIGTNAPVNAAIAQAVKSAEITSQKEIDVTVLRDQNTQPLTPVVIAEQDTSTTQGEQSPTPSVVDVTDHVRRQSEADKMSTPKPVSVPPIVSAQPFVEQDVQPATEKEASRPKKPDDNQPKQVATTTTDKPSGPKTTNRVAMVTKRPMSSNETKDQKPIPRSMKAPPTDEWDAATRIF